MTNAKILQYFFAGEMDDVLDSLCHLFKLGDLC